jgi:inositol-pentakisphosphate 2-kinase
MARNPLAPGSAGVDKDSTECSMILANTPAYTDPREDENTTECQLHPSPSSLRNGCYADRPHQSTNPQEHGLSEISGIWQFPSDPAISLASNGGQNNLGEPLGPRDMLGDTIEHVELSRTQTPLENTDISVDMDMRYFANLTEILPTLPERRRQHKRTKQMAPKLQVHAEVYFPFPGTGRPKAIFRLPGSTYTGPQDHCGTPRDVQRTYSIILEFFAEGAANVLFSINAMHPLSNSVPILFLPYLRQSLLRLRKGSNLIMSERAQPFVLPAAPPPYVCACKTSEFHQKFIYSWLLAEDVVTHSLVIVEPALTKLLNQCLFVEEITERREANRRGWFMPLARCASGFLLQDMRAKHSNAFSFEFKPKWLQQSPCAPTNARRCRTCAMQAMRGIAADKRYCPLALVSGDPTIVKRQMEHFMQKKGLPLGWDWDRVLDAVTAYFCDPARGLGAMWRLANLQYSRDWYGVLRRVEIEGQVPESYERIAADALKKFHKSIGEQLVKAMTLRDCTMFVRLEEQGLHEGAVAFKIEAKLVDLDCKSVDVKRLLKWKLDEYELIRDGYYMGTEEKREMDEESIEVCMLWR